MIFGKKKIKRGFCSIAGDIIHHGHVAFIWKCRKRCDYLIVGVPTDECIEKYKGKKPIMTYVERASTIVAIKGVSRVIMHHTFDLKEVLELTMPDILFDSEKHRGKRLKADVYIPYTEGISSSIIKERIIEASRSRKK